jgi:hypothetical protein
MQHARQHPSAEHTAVGETWTQTGGDSFDRPHSRTIVHAHTQTTDTTCAISTEISAEASALSGAEERQRREAEREREMQTRVRQEREFWEQRLVRERESWEEAQAQERKKWKKEEQMVRERERSSSQHQYEAGQDIDVCMSRYMIRAETDRREKAREDARRELLSVSRREVMTPEESGASATAAHIPSIMQTLLSVRIAGMPAMRPCYLDWMCSFVFVCVRYMFVCACVCRLSSFATRLAR